MKRFTTAPDAKGKRVLLGLLAAVFWIAVWQAVSMAVGQELLVPAPLKVAGTLWRLLGSALFWKAAGFSLLRVAAGFLAGGDRGLRRGGAHGALPSAAGAAVLPAAGDPGGPGSPPLSFWRWYGSAPTGSPLSSPF